MLISVKCWMQRWLWFYIYWCTWTHTHIHTHIRAHAHTHTQKARKRFFCHAATGRHNKVVFRLIKLYFYPPILSVLWKSSCNLHGCPSVKIHTYGENAHISWMFSVWKNKHFKTGFSTYSLCELHQLVWKLDLNFYKAEIIIADNWKAIEIQLFWSCKSMIQSRLNKCYFCWNFTWWQTSVFKSTFSACIGVSVCSVISCIRICVFKWSYA